MKVGVIVGIIAVVLVAGIGGFVVAKRMSDPVGLKVEEARSLGLPVTIRDIFKTSLPPSENAAGIVQQAIDKIHDSESGDADLKLVATAVVKGASDSDRQEGEKALKRLQPEMALIAKATKFPHCEFPIDWNHAAQTSFAYGVTLKAITKAFCLQAEFQNSKADTQGALQSIETAHGIARLLAENHLLLPMLIQVACDSIVEISLHHIIDLRRRDARFLSSIKRLHDTFGPLPDFRQTAKTELVYTLVQIDQAKTLKDLLGETADSASLLTEKDKHAARVHALACNITFARNWPKDDDWNAVHKAAQLAKQADPVDTSKVSKQTAAILKDLSLSIWEGLSDAVERLQARRRLTDTALQLFLQSAHDGRLPKQLPDFGLSRIDPFSGHPFTYQPSGAGFTLYGFGANRKDDHGDPRTDDVLTFD